MFTGQFNRLCRCRRTFKQSGKGFISLFHQSLKELETQEDKTLWITCFVNFDTKIMEYIKRVLRYM